MSQERAWIVPHQRVPTEGFFIAERIRKEVTVDYFVVFDKVRANSAEESALIVRRQILQDGPQPCRWR